jgi:oligopeptide transport system substrate-binding protein
MRKIIALLGLLVVASMILSACGAPAAPAEPQTIVQTQVVVATAAPEAKPAALRVNIGTYPDVIDPQKSSYVIEIATLKQIYLGLTTFNEKLETVPGAAEKWAYNADATELTFTLKKGLKYSDGSPLNAKRFEYALQRNIDPTTAGEYASITDEILNAPEVRAGDAPTCVANVAAAELAKVAADAKIAADAAPTDTKLADAAKAAADAAAAAPIGCSDDEKAALKAGLGVKASHADGAACTDYADEACDTLKLTFSKPAPYFHTIMGIWVAYPAKQENIEEGGDLWWNSSKYQIGNGPFIMDVVEPFVRQHFVPNPNFAGAGIPTYELEYRYITDGAVSFEAFKNGELDIIGLGGEDLATVQADPNLKAMHMQYAGSCTTLIKFGLAAKYTGADGKEFDSPFLDKKVREAFALAFDAAGWSKDVDAGLSAPTWTWIPPGYPGYDAASPLKFDVAAAKAALDASTFGPGPDKLNALGLKLTFGDTPRNRQRSEWLVAKYKENLGVDIALDPIDTTTFTAITKDPKTFPLLARQGWCADYPDPQNWLSVYWRSDTTFAQRMGYKNEEFDKLTKQADVELDPAKRMDLYKQAQQLLLADIPSAFGYNSTNSYMVQPWVKGVTTTPQDSDWAGSMVPWAITIDTAMQK